MKEPRLKGHCHGHVGQSAQIFYKESAWFEHELLLQLREENCKVFSKENTNCNQFLATSLTYTV